MPAGSAGERRAGRSERAQRRGRGQAVADGGQIARAAAAERQARQRALDIGRALQRRAHAVAQPSRRRRRTPPCRAARSIASDRSAAPPGGRPEPRAGAGQGAVDGGEQRALALAGQGLRLSSRLRRVAASISIAAPRASAPRRRQARQPALLGQLDVIDQRAGGGDLGAAEAAEAVERLRRR